MNRAVDVDLLVRNGWAIALRGLLASAFGACVILRSHLAMPALVIGFGMYSVVDGIFAFFVALQRRGPNEPPHWAYLVVGLSSIAVGLTMLLWSGITIALLVDFVAGGAVISGLAQLAAALRLRQQVRGEWILVVAGLAAVAFGVASFILSVGSPTLARWIGGYRIVDGALLAALALRLRSWDEQARAARAVAPEPLVEASLERELAVEPEPSLKIEVEMELVPERAVEVRQRPPLASPSAD